MDPNDAAQIINDYVYDASIQALQNEASSVTHTPRPLDILKHVFGYSAFRGQQEEVIESVMQGQSCLVLMPTGAGKSLCYQIPALCRNGVAIVISPLIALMDDQVRALRALGVSAGALHSGMSYQDVARTQDALVNGALDILYVAPERLMTADFQHVLRNISISLFAIDEAHCISQWGHDFRPEYRQLFILREMFPNVPCLAVTATADEPTRQDIIEKLSLDRIFVGGFDRPNIHYIVARKDSPTKQLLAFLKGRGSQDSGIVYALSRKKVEETAKALCEAGYKALPYHAGLSTAVRAANQERFIIEEDIIMVATIAFGMGINKPNVRFVAHIDLPKNIEAYYQETGRAGRDGLPSIAWMVYGMQDVVLQRQMIESSDMPEDQKRVVRRKLDRLLAYCESVRCRRQILLDYFNDEIAPCGQCDVCIDPPQTIDGTVPALKFLSCVYRTGQRFGMTYVIQILRGEEDERIKQNGHDTLSTFGIGNEYDKIAWQGIARQLVGLDLIYVDMDNHNVMRLTEAGAQFLREKTPIALRLDEKAKKSSKVLASTNANSVILATQSEKKLLQTLRTLRLAIAKEQNLPPYVIFHDKSLIEMVMLKPVTLEQLAMVHGVGNSKLERYGSMFVSVIKSHHAVHDSE
jgi:ATP-dependent DNA helicase RecQ